MVWRLSPLVSVAISAIISLEVVQPAKVKDGRGKRWFWLSLIAGALFAMLIYRWILKTGTAMKVDQTEAMGLGLWSTLLRCIYHTQHGHILLLLW